jgi:hypothetical protein
VTNRADEHLSVVALMCDTCKENFGTKPEELQKHFFDTGHIGYKLKFAGTANWRAVYGSPAEPPEQSEGDPPVMCSGNPPTCECIDDKGWPVWHPPSGRNSEGD